MKAIMNGEQSDLKFLTYSAHDWVLSTHLLWLDAINGNFTEVPFASNIVYELHSTKGCQEESCFWIEVLYNAEH